MAEEDIRSQIVTIRILGGGGTDISLRGEHNSTTFDTVNHWYSRIIVAGGGGGTEAWGSCVDGYGGGLSGGGEYPGT